MFTFSLWGKILPSCANWRVSLYSMHRICACVCLMMVAMPHFVNSDKSGVSAACFALALLHCIHTHTHTWDNQPFPLPQHGVVCTCMGLSVCKWRLLSMWQMGSKVAVHMRLTESHFWTQQPSYLPRIFWMGGTSCWTGRTQDLCKYTGRMCLGTRTDNCAK